MKKQLIACMVALSMLTACANNGMVREDGNVSKQGIGTLLGAGAGAVAGSNVGKGKGNIAAIAIGTLLGAGLGSSIGGSLDRADMAYYNNTSQRALEVGRSGEPVAWRNPDSGNYGTVTPMTVTQNTSGDYCREYSQSISVGGKTENAYGKACRQPDGSWKIIN